MSLIRLSLFFGWIYTLSWTLSFYPQLFLNYQRKTVTGLSFDFVVLNLYGFCCMFTYCTSFYFNPTIQSQYAARHDGKSALVQLNDVFFAGHAMFITAVGLLQVLYYYKFSRSHGTLTKTSGSNINVVDELDVDEEEIDLEASSHASINRNSNGNIASTPLSLISGTTTSPLLVQPSTSVDLFSLHKLFPPLSIYTTRFILATFVIVFFMALSISWSIFGLEWIDLVILLGYAKIITTIWKYAPQLLLNFQRKTTVGFSVYNIQFDFIGGIFSIAQLVLDAYIAQDWSGIWGNPLKLGIGIVTLGYDTLFLLQHYVWFNRSRQHLHVPLAED